MAADLGGSQISALLESVPGIVNVLRSPVADAIVNMIRAGAGVRPFSYADAEELVQYAVRRGLISAAEGDEVLEDAKGAGRGGRRPRATGTKRPAKKPASKKKPVASKKKAAVTKKKTATKSKAKAQSARAKTAKKKASKKKPAKKPAGRKTTKRSPKKR